jgi:hypothetical protein
MEHLGCEDVDILRLVHFPTFDPVKPNWQVLVVSGTWRLLRFLLDKVDIGFLCILQKLPTRRFPAYFGVIILCRRRYLPCELLSLVDEVITLLLWNGSTN